MIRDFLDQGKKLPPVLFLNLDNCPKENKVGLIKNNGFRIYILFYLFIKDLTVLELIQHEIFKNVILILILLESLSVESYPFLSVPH